MKTYHVYTKTDTVLEVKAEGVGHCDELIYFLTVPIEEYIKSETRERYVKAIFNCDAIIGFQEVTND